MANDNNRFGQSCQYCKAGYDYALEAIFHAIGCPAHPDHIAAVAPKPISSLDAARFDRATHPAQVDPRTALVAALEWYDAQEEKPAHIAVLVGRDVGSKGCSGTKFFQAGTYRHHAQMGLCLEAMHLIRESGQ